MIRLPGALGRLQRLDAQRAGVPGEHWAAFGTGVMLLRRAARGRSPVVRLVTGAAGAMLLWRAASGRDGLLRRLRSR